MWDLVYRAGFERFSSSPKRGTSLPNAGSQSTALLDAQRKRSTFDRHRRRVPSRDRRRSFHDDRAFFDRSWSGRFSVSSTSTLSDVSRRSSTRSGAPRASTEVVSRSSDRHFALVPSSPLSLRALEGFGRIFGMIQVFALAALIRAHNSISGVLVSIVVRHIC